MFPPTTQFILPNDTRYNEHYTKLKNKHSADHFRLPVLDYLFQQKFSLPDSLFGVSIPVLSELTYLIRVHRDHISFLEKNDRDGTHKNDTSPSSIAMRHENEIAVAHIIKHFSSNKMFDIESIRDTQSKVKEAVCVLPLYRL